MLVISSIIVLSALLVASYCDIRTREVPDWLNYSLICAGVATGLLASLVYGTWTYAAFSLLGLGVFVALAYVMFYAGQWGGGDSKLLMGIGAAAGLEFSLSYPWLSAQNFLFGFWINTLLAGVGYAIAWSIALGLRHRKVVSERFAEEVSRRAMLRNIVLGASMLFAVFALFARIPEMRMAIFMLALISFFSFYALMLIKAVEKSCMYKLMPPDKLTEGDWIAHDILIGGKYVCGPKDLGISKKQIALLRRFHTQKKISRILVKEGIPFVPSFLIGFILTLIWGNFLFAVF
jgi:Flp pilus assembly protein protease CpaA